MNHNGTNNHPLHIHDDKNGLDYTLHGDYYLPDLEVPKAPPLNRWGRMAFDTLKKQHPGRFTWMLLDGGGGNCNVLFQGNISTSLREGRIPS